MFWPKSNTQTPGRTSRTLSGFGFVGGPGLVYSMGISSLWMVVCAVVFRLAPGDPFLAIRLILFLGAALAAA